MPNTIISPNMNLVIPVVGVDPGPQWATDLNSSLTLIDQHDHSAGNGVQITPIGININSDFAQNNNNLTLVKTVRFSAQSSPIAATTPNLGCIYVAGVDLFYNDGSGNQIRITQSGSVTGSAGTITGLPSGTASAAFSSGTFIFQSATNTAANIDGGSYILRNSTANSHGLTLAPPNAMAADYSITLPTLPATQSFMTLNAAGTMAAPWTVDNSTIVVSSNQVKVPNGGITNTQIADTTITEAKLAIRGTSSTPTAGQVGISSSCGTFSTNSTSFTTVTNLSITLPVYGRPVYIGLIADDLGSPAEINVSGTVVTSSSATIQILRDSVTAIGINNLNIVGSGSTVSGQITIPASGYSHYDTPSAGTHGYQVQVKVNNGSSTVNFENIKLIAYEIS